MSETDMIKELAEVMQLSSVATDGVWTTTFDGGVKQSHGVSVFRRNALRGNQAEANSAYTAHLSNFIRARHAEIAQNAESAKRLRALEQAMNEMDWRVPTRDINRRAEEILRGS